MAKIDGEADAELAAKAARVHQIVEAWFLEKVPNSPVSQNTQAFNHVRAAVNDLKARLVKEL